MQTNNTSNQTMIDRLFSVGAHFGFTKSRRHPSVASYIYGAKHGTDIFDLEKTAPLLEAAKKTLEEAGAQGKTVLFVGTKEEAAVLVEATAKSVEMPYVVNRWIGGMLTNFTEIKKRLLRLEDLIAQGESGELERKYTKKERVLIKRELDKLMHNFGGMRTLKGNPALMVVVDPRHDHIAVTEAAFQKIPVIGIMSSDCNMNDVTTPVILNDTLRSSVQFALSELAAAYTAGRANFKPAPEAARRRPGQYQSRA